MFSVIARLTVVAVIVFGLVVMQGVCDAEQWHWPWYFLHQIFMGVLPMGWLLFHVMVRAKPWDRMGFLVTSALLILVSGMFELVAIQHRFWWFLPDWDRFIGLRVGDIPIEEFTFYPLFLNIPVLFYVWLEGRIPSGFPRRPTSDKAKFALRVAGGVFAVTVVGLLWHAFTHETPALDRNILPVRDPYSHSPSYSAGPPEHGWTIVQTLTLSAICFLYANLRDRIDHRRMLLTLVVYMVYAFFDELMACGRGWWVWNHQQVLGIFTWVLPIESYVMYFVGVVVPIIAYEGIRPYFEPPRPA